MKPKHSRGDDGENGENPRAGEDDRRADVAHGVAQQRGQDDDGAAHRGVPALCWWVGPSSRIT